MNLYCFFAYTVISWFARAASWKITSQKPSSILQIFVRLRPVVAQCTSLVLGVSRNPLRKCVWISGLHEDCTRACTHFSTCQHFRSDGLGFIIPVNLHTRPSPELRPDMMPPLATRSRIYLQFHATRCPLSMIYFSSFSNCMSNKKLRQLA